MSQSRALPECHICEEEIQGTPFVLSDLKEPANIIELCESCATSNYAELYHEGLELKVWRDHFLPADKERLFYAVDNAMILLAEHGWEITDITLTYHSDMSCEPLK